MAQAEDGRRAEPEDPKTALEREERRWREQLVGGLLWVVIVTGSLTTLFGATGPELRWATTPFLVLTAMALAVKLLPRPPYFLRAVAVVGTLFVGGTLGLLIYGTGPNALVALATAVATTTMLAGRRAGVLMLAVCTLVLCVVFGSYIAGVFTRPNDWYQSFDTTRPHIAARLAVLFAACTGILAFGISHLVERANAHLAETTRALFDLRRKEAERAALERQVELQRASVRRAEEAEVLFRLSGYAAHDFGNALTVMRGTLETLRPLPENAAEVREALEALNEAVEGAVHTHAELKALSGGSSAGGGAIEVEEHLHRLGRMLTFVLPARIRTRVAVQASGKVSCDATTFQRATMNLALNARDAMPDGGELSLLLRSPRSEEVSFSMRPPEDFVCLEVTDTGSGIRADEQDRIFEPYFTTKGAGGTGLGLASVRDSLRALGGDVVVHSAPGKGATFAVYWPRVAESEQSVESASLG